MTASDNSTQTKIIADSTAENGSRYFVTLSEDGKLSRTHVFAGYSREAELDAIGEIVWDIHGSLTLGQAADIISQIVTYANKAGKEWQINSHLEQKS